MPRTSMRRSHYPGGSIFFTAVTEDRTPILIEEIARLRRAFEITRRRHPFVVEGIVVLPDHLHTIWRLPEGDSDYSLRWRVLKRLFSAGMPSRVSRASQVGRREKGIWQRRFFERCLRDANDWRAHLDYIHYNPVKHGYCRLPVDWGVSSFRRYVDRGWYAVDWGPARPIALPIDPE